MAANQEFRGPDSTRFARRPARVFALQFCDAVCAPILAITMLIGWTRVAARRVSRWARRGAESFQRTRPRPFRSCRISGRPYRGSGKISLVSTASVSNDFPEEPGGARRSPEELGGARLPGKSRAGRIKFPPGSDSNFNYSGRTTAFGNSKHDSLMAVTD
jgi:hypothetical protein